MATLTKMHLHQSVRKLLYIVFTQTLTSNSLAFALINATDAKLPLSQDALDDERLTVRKSDILPIRANTLRFEVPPGKYIILPLTKSNDDLDFLLRVFSEMPVNLNYVTKDQ